MTKIYKVLIVTDDSIEDSTIIQRMRQMSNTGFIDMGIYNEDDELVERVNVAKDEEIVLDFTRSGMLKFVCPQCGSQGSIIRAAVKDDYVYMCPDCHIPMDKVD